MVPFLIAIQQNQADGLPAFRRQGIPDIASRGAADSVHGHATVNGVAGGTGGIVAVRLNTVQRVIRVRDAAIPGEVPAHIFDIGGLCASSAVWLIADGHLIIQHCGVVAVVGVVKQHNAVLGTGNGHDRIIIGCFRRKRCRCRVQCWIIGRFRRLSRFYRVNGFFRLRGCCHCFGSFRRVCVRHNADKQHENQQNGNTSFQVQSHWVILSIKK